MADVEFWLRGIAFRWNPEKAKRNLAKHGVSFEAAAQIFFDPFLRYQDATRQGEQRDGAVGCDFEMRVLYVVHLIVEDEYIRLISARKADAHERASYEDGND